ncbi:hypothetical protein [Phycicoccus flavus]|uniref:hypothetical protein n=1 Tax=Phycicoccus flavus TaxID=2502783 RepID=UPI000FEBCEE5|nr:hypothetical protein [Phycicoccus flavus]NHA67065.1 hypothetical protein [Phycicoccus flavus]
MNDRPGEMDERDVDERFASIVARWDVADDATSAPGTPARPDPRPRPDAPSDAAGPAPREDTPRAEDPEPPAAEPPPRRPVVNPSPITGVHASSWRVVQPPDPDAPPVVAPGPDDDEHFEPPSVQLPPQEDLHFWGAVLGLVAGPLCLVYVAMARPFHSTRWFLAGLALSLVGFALLVLRSPSNRDGDDDGARV